MVTCSWRPGLIAPAAHIELRDPVRLLHSTFTETSRIFWGTSLHCPNWLIFMALLTPDSSRYILVLSSTAPDVHQAPELHKSIKFTRITETYSCTTSHISGATPLQTSTISSNTRRCVSRPEGVRVQEGGLERV
jgi:hypothetical protein